MTQQQRQPVYYFAYGPDLSLAQMKDICPDARARFKATLPNYKLVFTGWSRKWHGGLAALRQARGEKVIGGVYEISARCLQALDRYHGYPSNSSRIKVVVFPEAGEAVEAITYSRTDQAEEAGPSPEYRQLIRQGYRDWDII